VSIREYYLSSPTTVSIFSTILELPHHIQDGIQRSSRRLVFSFANTPLQSFQNPTQIFADDVTEEKGENARLSAFVGAIAVGDLVKSTLGPKGMDKILQSAYDGQARHCAAGKLKRFVGHPARSWLQMTELPS